MSARPSDRERLTGTLSAVLSASGRKCELEAGAGGLLVYASTRVDVAAAARKVLRAVVDRDSRAVVTGPEHDPEEPGKSAWWAEVTFDWGRL